MEAAELDVALEELETRLERLRALYEQYFMGLEKIEPAIARKDVDRRIYVLRREKIRNTAKRFKLQTIIQRYNTFQQYWQRICREIENGTYKRHLLRAQKQNPNQLLTIAARKRLGRQASQSQPPEGAVESATGSQPPSAPPSAPPSVAPRVAPPHRTVAVISGDQRASLRRSASSTREERACWKPTIHAASPTPSTKPAERACGTPRRNRRVPSIVATATTGAAARTAKGNVAVSALSGLVWRRNHAPVPTP